MNCPKCFSNKSGNSCKICETVFKEKKQPKTLKKSTKPINKVSKKMSSDLREYGKLRKQFLLDNPVCAVYKEKKATTVHHSRGRGRYLLDTTTWVPASMEGHTYIELHPEWSKAQGYSLERLKTTI